MTWELDLFNHDFFFFFLQDVEEGTDRGSVGFSVFRVVSPSSQGECGCRGSTTLPQHAQCSLCFVYSCQPTESLLPIMYSRQCCFVFFTVQCLFSVPVAAVNRLLESCCFPYYRVFGLSRLLQVPSPRSVSSHRRMCVPSVVVRFSRLWGKCHGNSDSAKAERWQEC